jgi:hypothetical protein
MAVLLSIDASTLASTDARAAITLRSLGPMTFHSSLLAWITVWTPARSSP